MELFWTGRDGSIDVIHTALSERRCITRSTIHSTLGRLMDKLVMEKEIEKNTIQTLVNLKKILEGRPNLRAVH